MSRWLEVRLKHLSSVAISNGLGERGEFDDPTWPRYIRTTDIAGPSELRTDTFKSLPPDVAQGAMLVQGDLLMTAAGATIGKSFTFKESYSACFAGYLVRFRPDRRQVDGRFVAYWMQSSVYWAQVDAQRVKSTIENFSASRYQNLKLAVPPLAAQRAIADYLDAETARIDALIEKKRRMVELLEERLKLKAHQLTTSEGDDMALRHAVLQVKTGTTPASDELIRDVSGSVPWYSPGDVGEWLSLAPPARTLPATAISACQVPVFPRRSVLVVGIGATAGRVAHLDHEASGNQQMTCITPGPSLDSRFLAWQLFARSDEIRSTAPFTTLPILNNDFIKSIVLRVPQASCQKMIATQLDEDARRTHSLVGCIERQVVKFREHREALITAAITGELSIPGVAA